MQATWNLHERSAESSLARAHEAGLRVLVKEALANGRLTARGADETLAGDRSRAGHSEDAVALAAALARPWADVVLSGAATVAQLESNLAALDLAWDDGLEQRLSGPGRGAGGVLGYARRAPLDLAPCLRPSSASNQSNVRVTAFFQ